jgi:hypothetical protein
MKHFIYKTTHVNGKYYIGRHSTDNIDDGYIGSGRWPRSIKDKSVLTREILEFAEDYDHLIRLENQYLVEHYGKPNCMNMSNVSTGYATGNANPMNNPETASKISGDNHWSRRNPEKYKEKFAGSAHWMNKNPEAKRKFIENTPHLDGRNARLAYERGTHVYLANNPSIWRSEQGIHHWQNGNSPNYEGKLNKKLVEEGRHNWLGPDANNKRISEGTHNFLGSASNEKMLAEGSHPSQQKKICEHCDKSMSVGMYKRWHGDNCKFKESQ